jgi:hypothetical protein
MLGKYVTPEWDPYGLGRIGNVGMGDYIAKPSGLYGLDYYLKADSQGFGGLYQDMNLKDSLMLLAAVAGGMVLVRKFLVRDARKVSRNKCRRK